MYAKKLLPLTLLGLTATGAWAATPGSGELSAEAIELAWDGDGPYVFPNVTPQLGVAGLAPLCEELQPLGCDIYTLTVNVSDEFRTAEANQRETVSIGITFPQDPAGQVDYDLYLHDESGAEVGNSAGAAPQTSETIVVPLKTLKNGSYAVKVITFTPLGTNYAGFVRIGKGAEAAKAMSIAPQIGSAPLTVTIDAGSAPADTNGYVFDFGDGSAPVTSTVSTVQHTYQTPGQHLVRVSYSDASGSKSLASAAQPVVVLGPETSKAANQFGGAFGLTALLGLIGLGFAGRRRR